MQDNTPKNKEKNDVDTSFYYMSKKTERLLSALHLITEHINAAEPIRSQIRLEGIHLLNGVIAWHEGSQSPEEVVGTIRRLTSLLSVAVHARLLSEMNGKILQSVLEELFASLTHHAYYQQESATGVTLPENFFIFDEMPEPSSMHSQMAPKISKGHIVDKRHNTQVMSYKNDQPQQRTTDNPSQKVSERRSEEPRQKQKNRRARILAILQSKEKINIRDIAKEITDCSEKTLQRELLALVQQGILKKEGERRWSTYSMA